MIETRIGSAEYNQANKGANIMDCTILGNIKKWTMYGLKELFIQLMAVLWVNLQPRKLLNECLLFVFTKLQELLFQILGQHL